MSDSRIGGYPMGVTDATIERYFGDPGVERCCGMCRNFCSLGEQLEDYGYCHLRFERAYDEDSPERKEGRWRLAQWAAGWIADNVFDCNWCDDDCADFKEA